MSKKDYERRKREEAEKKLNDAAESEQRKARIGELWRELTSGDLVSKGADESDLANHPLVVSLAELAELQKREIDYLEQFRHDWERIQAHYPEQLANLSSVIIRAEFEQLIKTGIIKLSKRPKPTPKQQSERKRRIRKQPGGVGLIEYEFGGAGEAAWRNQPLTGLLGLAYQPTCLDDIFAGKAVSMRSQIQKHARRFEDSGPRTWRRHSARRQRAKGWRQSASKRSTA